MVRKIVQNLLRKKTRFFLTPLLIVSIFFILYQLIIFTELTKKPNVEEIKIGLVRGIHPLQRHFYEPNKDLQFTCIHSMENINIELVNDDYCDCLDGSDEPGTNACPNGKFFCLTQVLYPGFVKSLPTSRVNDGICDCCDGSDEWKDLQLHATLDRNTQNSLHRYLSPCPNLCVKQS